LQATKTRGFVKIRLFFFMLCSIPLALMAQGEGAEKMFPIEQIQRGFRNKFVYKRQVIDNPFALQIPLLESKDPEVSLEFHRFKSKRNLIYLISIPGAGLSVYSWLNPGKVSDGFRISIAGASALVNIYLSQLSMYHLNRAISKYNALANASPQLSLEFTPTNQTFGSSLALQWKYNF
jgi:hypothetical protein